MKIDDIYEEIRSILKAHEISEEESGDMIDYLQESAAESGMAEEDYICTLGTPEQIANDFMNESKHLKEDSRELLPPLPELPDPHRQINEEGDSKPQVYGPLSEDRIPENYLKEEEEDFDTSFGSNRDTQSAGSAETERSYRLNQGCFINKEEETWYSIPAERFERIRSLHISLSNAFCAVKTGTETGIRVLEGEKYISVTIRKDQIHIEQNPAAVLPFFKEKKGRVEITVPDSAVFEKIHSDSINMSLEADRVVSEKIHLETVNGSLILRNASARRITLSSANGTLEASGCGFRKLTAECVNGQILVDASPSMKISAESVSGKINAQEPFNMYIHKELVGSSLRYTPQCPSEQKTGKISVNNVSGEIRIGCRE